MDVSTSPASTLVLGPTSPARRGFSRTRWVAAALVVGAVVAVGAVTAEHQQHDAPATGQVQQLLVRDRLAKAARLDAVADVTLATSTSVMSQVHAVTGNDGTAQQARTRLYQELRDRTGK